MEELNREAMIEYLVEHKDKYSPLTKEQLRKSFAHFSDERLQELIKNMRMKGPAP